MQPTQATSSVIAVVLTYNRPQLLVKTLTAISHQDYPLTRIIVIDNHSTERLNPAEWHFSSTRIDYYYLPENLGGAGGFATAIETAGQHRPDFLWLMDDDGLPRHNDCLSRLIATAAEQHSDITAPAVLDIEAPERLAFPVRTRHKTHFFHREIADVPLISGFAHLFNGVLLRQKWIPRIGLPDARLFIRGDEVDYLLRAQRQGAKIVLDTQAEFLHPSSNAEIFPVYWGLFYATYPHDARKRFFQFRNRGYIFFTHKMYHYLIFDLFRYSYFFIIGRHGDVSGLWEWLRLTVSGMRMPKPE